MGGGLSAQNHGWARVSGKTDPSYKILDDRHLYNSMGMFPIDVFRLVRYYKQIDFDTNGTIDRKELMGFLDQADTGFVKRMFSMFDEDYDNNISFKEFVVGSWNYLTISSSSLPIFTFDLYDHDGSGVIELKEVMIMMRDLYGDQFESNESAKTIITELTTAAKAETNDKSNVCLRSKGFQEFCKAHPELLKPASDFQGYLRKKICGRKFWLKLSKRRIDLPNGSDTKVSVWIQQRAETTGTGRKRRGSKVEQQLYDNCAGTIAERRTSKQIEAKKTYKTPSTVRRAVARIAETMSPPAQNSRRVGKKEKKKKKQSKKIDPEIDSIRSGSDTDSVEKSNRAAWS
jgi:Ca2+-binding EF-hand superfamily protein